MTKMIVTLALLALAAGCAATPERGGPAERREANPENPHIGALRHVVLFKFSDDATDEQVREIERDFRALPDEIETIRDFEWGHTDVTVEDLHRGFTHCFLVTFDDVEGLEEYIPHPAHERFVAKLRPLLDEVLVVDYYARD